MRDSHEEEMVTERMNDDAEIARARESDLGRMNDEVKIARERVNDETARGRDTDDLEMANDVEMARQRVNDDVEMVRERVNDDYVEMARESESNEAERAKECMADPRCNFVIRDEDEDTLGRYEFEIEEAVAEFEDEAPTERNEIPESSDDSFEDEMDVREKRMQKRSSDRLALGSSYYTVYEFKELVLEYALNKRRNIKQDRWDKTKVSYVCGIGGKCKWRLYCSYDKDMQKWVLKTKYKYHSCTPDGKCKLLKSHVIARLFLDKLRQKDDLMPEEIQQIIKEKWKIVSTRNQCQRGRLLALKWLQKEYDDQFAHLRGYAEEILETNKGSSAIVDTYKNAEGKDVFNRFYVCFRNLRETWRGYCRPIIRVDGTFLKRALKGVLLTAIGHDANNQIYPISWVVVQSETTDNWIWFIQQIKRDLVLEDGGRFVIITDRSKGLKTAMERELPKVEHRKCANTL